MKITHKNTHTPEGKDVTLSKSVLPRVALIISFAVIAVLQQCLGGLQRGVALTQLEYFHMLHLS